MNPMRAFVVKCRAGSESPANSTALRLLVQGAGGVTAGYQTAAGWVEGQHSRTPRRCGAVLKSGDPGDNWDEQKGVRGITIRLSGLRISGRLRTRPPK